MIAHDNSWLLLTVFAVAPLGVLVTWIVFHVKRYRARRFAPVPVYDDEGYHRIECGTG